jgi:hypothetical protein
VVSTYQENTSIIRCNDLLSNMTTCDLPSRVLPLCDTPHEDPPSRKLTVCDPSLAQGLHQGLGSGAGSSIGGVLYGHFGARDTFLMAAGGAGFSLILIILIKLTGHRQAPHKGLGPKQDTYVVSSLGSDDGDEDCDVQLARAVRAAGEKEEEGDDDDDLQVESLEEGGRPERVKGCDAPPVEVACEEGQ